MAQIFTNKWIQIFILITLLIIATYYGSFSDTRWRQNIQNLNFDTYNILRPYETHDHVIIVDIDDRSLSHPDLGQWPWARTKLATLVEKLKSLGATVVAFDMVFSEADRTSPHYMLDSLDATGEKLKQVNELLKDVPDNDQVFSEAIEKAGNVVTGYSFAHGETRQPPRSIAKIEGDDILDLIPNYKAVTSNLKELTGGSAGNGSFFVSPDKYDGIIRKVPLLVTYSRHSGEIRRPYPALALEAYRVNIGGTGYNVVLDDPEDIKRDPENAGIKEIRMIMGKQVFPKGIPTTSRGEFLVHFANPDVEQEKWYVSALDVFNDSVDPERIKNKIVFIGTSAVGLKDLRSTPVRPFRPGVEVHLNILDQILEKEFLYRNAGIKWLERDLTFVIGGFILLLTPFVNLLLLLFVVLLSIAAAFYGGWYAFVEYGYLIDVLYPSIALFCLFMVSALFSYMRTEVEKKQIRGAFGHYVSPELMEELANNPDRLQLGGETRELSVMFTDIRSFTTISESLTPEELIQLMNNFLTPMSDLVMQNRGTIDKYMGDAMMAFWNAPLDDKNHARNACLTTLKMNEALKPINEALAVKAKEEGRAQPLVLSAGIGVNTGPASVGNMGSKQRFAYSALGDTVNLASRLEGQTKTYGVTNLIGEETYKHVSDLAALEIDMIRVKGKVKPVRVFTLLGNEKWTKNKAYQDWAACHAAMLEKYRGGDFAAALQLIAQCRELSRGNLRAFYDLYEKRIAEFHASPPGPEWDGVYVATSK